LDLTLKSSSCKLFTLLESLELQSGGECFSYIPLQLGNFFCTCHFSMKHYSTNSSGNEGRSNPSEQRVLTCPHPNEGHQTAATRSNTMGGSAQTKGLWRERSDGSQLNILLNHDLKNHVINFLPTTDPYSLAPNNAAFLDSGCTTVVPS
jgi:hypothetical protein